MSQRAPGARCVLLGTAPDAPLLFTYVRKGEVMFGRVTPKTSSDAVPEITPKEAIVWSSTWVPLPASPTSAFNWASGMGFTFADRSVRLLSGAPNATFTVIEHSPSVSHRSHARDGLLVWTTSGEGGPEVVKGYRAGGHVETLVKGMENVHIVGLSADRLVWIGTHGPNVTEGRYKSAALHWRTRTDQDGFAVVHRGLKLPATSGLLELRTSGDYAATSGCNGPTIADCRVLVARLSTAKLWVLPMRKGKRFQTVLALSKTELLLGETDEGADLQRLERIVRLRLDSLDEISRTWVAARLL